ncbi:MAG TPA: efflux RND transporter permease subunit [Anaerolineae bacterium]|nr:efflux RND transporter permease subunit [Anaerolineae bacterium]
MLANLFDRITRTSVHWRWVTLAATFIILAAGAWSATGLNQEMLPRVEFPQTIVVAQWSDSESATQFLETITKPFEEQFAQIDGVVNVESTTNRSFAFIIVRNEFGLNQERVINDIKTIINEADLPDGMETPQTINFSFSDLPVISASVFAEDLTLDELKEVMETDFQPRIEAVDQVSQVNISGGQVLPEEEPTPTPAPTLAPTPSPTPIPPADYDTPSPLPRLLIRGVAEYGYEVEFAQDVTPDMAWTLVSIGPIGYQAIELLTVENLRVLDPEVLAYLPTDYTDSLEPWLFDELNERAADFGGIGQFSLAEAQASAANGINILTGQRLDGETDEQTDTDTITDTLAYPPVPLPESWIGAAAAQGLTISTTADIDANFMGAIVALAPQSLAELTPEMLYSFSADVIAVLPQEYLAGLDPEVQATLASIHTTSQTTIPADPTPLPLPQEWIAGAAAQGLTISTTADLTPEFMSTIAAFAPEQLALLTPPMWRVLPINTLSTTLPLASDTLSPTLTTQLNAILAAANGQQPEPVDLPASWVGASAAAGFPLTTTADLTPEAITGLATLGPELLLDLTPDILVSLDPALQALLPPDLLANFDEGTQQTVQIIAIRAAQYEAKMAANQPDTPRPADPTPLTLPQEWIVGAAAQNLIISTTADITPEFMTTLASFSPDQLALITSDMWRVFDPAVISVALDTVPDNFEEPFIYELQAIVAAANDAPPPDIPLPAELLPLLEQAGITATTTAEFFSNPANLALLPTEGTDDDQAPFYLLLGAPRQFLADGAALLPLDDGLAQTVAIVQLRAQQAAWDAEAAALAAGEGSTEVEPEPEPVDPARLPDMLIQMASAQGMTMENAQDIPPEFARALGSFGEQGTQLLGMLSDDNLRLLQPQVIALLPMGFLNTLDADLRTELDELASEYGGAGQLAIQEAEAAAALAAGAPAMSGRWIEPTEEGEESQFQTAADLINNGFLPDAASFINVFPGSPNVDNPPEWLNDLTPEVIQFLEENEDGFISNLDLIALELFSPETINFMLENYRDQFEPEVAERLEGIAAGTVKVFIPESTVTRTDGNASLLLDVFKDGDANTVVVAERIFALFEEYQEENPNIQIALAFEQASFITESINGVAREGTLGAVFAVIVILIFLSGQVNGRYKPSWRATIITGLSIPSSILFAFLLMRWIPQTIGEPLNQLALDSTGTAATILGFIAKLFPNEITLNIMTLSGLTVAIGRVVDDSIVVLENIYRFIQRGDDPLEAAFAGTREVAVAIFSATVTTMAVFLPLGLIGGVVGAVFLPFGMTVTYALAASYMVSITVVPALTYMLIRQEHIPEEKETLLQRGYTPLLKWVLNNRGVTLAGGLLLFIGSIFLMGQLPQSFIPAIGEPTINIRVNLPNGTPMVETNELIEELEHEIEDLEGLGTILTVIGTSGGFESIFGASGISQNLAAITISVEDQEELEELANEVRHISEDILGADNVVVSAAAQSGFGGFAIIVTGNTQEELRAMVDDAKAALAQLDVDNNGRPDIVNISSNLDDIEADSADSTIIRIDQKPAVRFSGELETDDTIGVITAAEEVVASLPSLPAGADVSQGPDAEQQTEGLQGMIVAILNSIIIVYILMAITFRSLMHPFTILFSLPFALVGAAGALYLTNSVLGISAMVGMLMLVGIVVTNGIVLLELVQQLRERGENAYDALIEGGRTRLRPIWMTALTAILALIPLAISEEGGAIIAAELATTVMGGLLVSTALTLLVIPVVYSLLDTAKTYVYTNILKR